MSNALTIDQILPATREVVNATPVTDIHTHLYDHNFGELLLWGLDELLTYHYLVAELFRASPMPYNWFWAMTKPQQAELIWRELFLNRSPVSEACRGVVTVLQAFGLDPAARDLEGYRRFFAQTSLRDHINRVLLTANVRALVMTNDPFDEAEHAVWEHARLDRDPRFRAALRLDQLIMHLGAATPKLQAWGYKVSTALDESDIAEARRFLHDWIERMQAEYLAVSLPPTFAFPENSLRGRIIANVVLPVAQERALPFALMIGVKKLINPGLRLAGDSVGKSDINAVEYLCENFPGNKFLVTMLSRENQHELCVTARKYSNLMVFGCWWFLNNPSIIEELTRERFELLGLSFIPQHSDARVLDQLVYKWSHSRRIIADILAGKYEDLARSGWQLTRAEIQRDVNLLFGGNFERFISVK